LATKTRKQKQRESEFAGAIAQATSGQAMQDILTMLADPHLQGIPRARYNLESPNGYHVYPLGARDDADST
jgi:hypothetical protein